LLSQGQQKISGWPSGPAKNLSVGGFTLFVLVKPQQNKISNNNKLIVLSPLKGLKNYNYYINTW